MLRTIVASVCVVATMLCAGAVAVEVVPEAMPPALPFKFLGKWTRNGQTTVLLERDHFPYAARLGQYLDHEYRVDAIEANFIVLTYIPLGVAQVLGFSTEPLPFTPGDAPTSPPTELVALTFSAPKWVPVEQDFLVGVGIRTAPGLSASATVDLSYDAALLHPVEGASSGHVSVRVNANGEEGSENKLAILRFHVSTVNPQFTRIEIKTQAQGTDGRALDIRAPESHELRIIP
jgi:hypothetical protein